MGYSIYDSRGYVADVASGGGLADFRAAAAADSPGPQTDALLSAGSSDAPGDLAAELAAASFDDDSADSVRAAIAAAAAKCKDVALLTDGVGFDPAEEPADEERSAAAEQPVFEQRSLDARQKAVDALAPVFCDVAARVASKESKAIRGLTKHLRENHPEQFERRANEFYDAYREQIGDSFVPPLSTLNVVLRRHVAEERADGDMQLGDDAAVGAYAKTLAGRHVHQAKQHLADMMTGEKEQVSDGAGEQVRQQPVNCSPAQNSPALIADRIDAAMLLREKSAPAAADRQLRQAAGFLTREAYRAAGCKSLRWVANPADGEECRALNGRVVAIDEPFAEGRHHPPLNDTCHCGIVGEA